MVTVSKVSKGKLQFLSKITTSCHSVTVSAISLLSPPPIDFPTLFPPTSNLAPLTSPPPSRRTNEHTILKILIAHSHSKIYFLYKSNSYFVHPLAVLEYLLFTYLNITKLLNSYK